MTTDAFEECRGHVFGIAYRMLGSVADAEDVVQETYLRWRDHAGDVRSPRAFLGTVATRVAIDRLRSAQHRRETYVGPWLPEPLVTEGDPFTRIELAESLTTAFLVLLDRLGPVERAVFLLREVFGYSYDEIAEAVGRSDANCRQIASRARRRIEADRPHAMPTPPGARPLVERFLVAIASGDLEALLGLMTDDVTLVSDGGAAARAARRPVIGPDKVARFLLNVAKRVPAGLQMRMASINGDPGVVFTVDGEPWGIISVAADDSAIHSVYALLSPEKLRHVAS